MSADLSGKTLLNQYEIKRLIAATPLGVQYAAEDTRAARYLFLTVLPPAVADDSEIIKELEAASNALRGIESPRIVPYYGLLQTPTLAFFLEEYVDGPSLADVLKNAPVKENEALVYAKAVGMALDDLHAQGYLHLNLAPELIHLNKNGGVQLSGLIAAQRIGRQAAAFKTKYPRLYLAPEQFIGGRPEPATDFYALAVMLYQLVTGVWINGRGIPKTPEALRKAHLDHTPPAPAALNPGLPDHFSRMLLWALRKNPEDRFKTSMELLSALALGAQTSADAIPPRTDPKHTPVSWAVLSQWQSMPPLQRRSIAQDQPSLQDRLASLDAPPVKKRRAPVMPVFLGVMLLGFLSLFFFVRPMEVPEIPTPIRYTDFIAPTGTPSPVVSATPRPTLTNGGRIAFTCTRGDFNQICMVNRDGTGLTQLTDMQASNYYPAFAPGGASLLFASNRNGPFDLYLLVFGQKQILRITENVGNVISPDYSPDGERIVFANRAAEGPTSIWMVNADGTDPRLVYAGPNTIVGVAWSPLGDKIAYAMSVGVAGEYEIFTMDVDGRNNLRVSQGLLGIGGSVDWSPDGGRLLIYAGPAGAKDIFTIDALTGEADQLTFGGNNAGGAYSPDGRYIVFNSLRNNDQADLYIMRSNGSNEVQLTNDPEPDWGAQWVE